MASAPSWATDARTQAVSALENLPALTGTEEEWRFTPPTDLALEGPAPADGTSTGTMPAHDPQGRAATVSFLDGRATSEPVTTIEGVTVADLATALSQHEDLTRSSLYSLVGFDTKPGALNAARWESGLFVHVAEGAQVELPIEALTWASGSQGQVFGRTLVVAERGASVTVIDRYGSADLPDPITASTVVEIIAHDEAEVEHVSVIDWGRGVRHHATIAAHVGRTTKVRSVCVTLGGDIVRVEPTMFIRGEGADGRALGLYFADDAQHFEHRVIARHEAPQAYSNLLYKGAIKDTAHTVFFGNLVVPPGAPGTDAYQTNRNLVLNEGARADTIPFLEIETAEVKCSHAGAVSRVDDEHLWYLESRGVSADQAKRLIVEGFCQEVLDEVGLDELRDELSEAIARKVRS